MKLGIIIWCCLFSIYYNILRIHRMVVGFTTTYAISAYHHWCCEFESRSGRGVQHYVLKFVSDRSVVLSTNKTDRHDITEILLKVALNTMKQTNVIIRGIPIFMDFVDSIKPWNKKFNEYLSLCMYVLTTAEDSRA